MRMAEVSFNTLKLRIKGQEPSSSSRLGNHFSSGSCLPRGGVQVLMSLFSSSRDSEGRRFRLVDQQED